MYKKVLAVNPREWLLLEVYPSHPIIPNDDFTAKELGDAWRFGAWLRTFQLLGDRIGDESGLSFKDAFWLHYDDAHERQQDGRPGMCWLMPSCEAPFFDLLANTLECWGEIREHRELDHLPPWTFAPVDPWRLVSMSEESVAIVESDDVTYLVNLGEAPRPTFRDLAECADLIEKVGP